MRLIPRSLEVSVIRKNMRRGKYFRIVADVYADGKNLAEALVGSGMTVRYNGGKENTC